MSKWRRRSWPELAQEILIILEQAAVFIVAGERGHNVASWWYWGGMAAIMLLQVDVILQMMSRARHDGWKHGYVKGWDAAARMYNQFHKLDELRKGAKDDGTADETER